MEKEKTQLYAEHTYAACISCGFQLLARNMLVIAKVLAPYILTSAMAGTILLALHLHWQVNTQVAPSQNASWTLASVCLPVLSLLCLFVSTITTARTFLVLRRLLGVEKSEAEGNSTVARNAVWKTNILRTWDLTKKILLFVLVYSLISGIMMLVSHGVILTIGKGFVSYLLMACLVILFLLIVFVVSPIMLYVFTSVMMAPQRTKDMNEEAKQLLEMHTLKASVRFAKKHLGKIIGVMLLGGFVLGLSCIIPMLPMLVSVMAYTSSFVSNLAMGDTVLIPTSGYICMFVASTLSLTFITFLTTAFNAALTYLYGDIITTEKTIIQ